MKQSIVFSLGVLFFVFSILTFMQKSAFAIIVDEGEYVAVPQDDDGVQQDTSIQEEEALMEISLDSPVAAPPATDYLLHGENTMIRPYTLDEWTQTDHVSTGENSSARLLTRQNGEEHIEDCRVCVLNNGDERVRYCYQTIHCGEDNRVEGTVLADETVEFNAQRSTLAYRLELSGRNAVGFLYTRSDQASVRPSRQMATVGLARGDQSAEVLFSPFEGDGAHSGIYSLVIENTGNESVHYDLLNGRNILLSGIIQPNSIEKNRSIPIPTDSECILKISRPSSFFSNLFSCCSARPRAQATATIYAQDEGV